MLSCSGGSGTRTLSDLVPQPAYHIVDPLNQASRSDTTREEVERITPFLIISPSFVPDGYEPVDVEVTLPLSRDTGSEKATKAFITFMNPAVQSVLQLTELAGSSQTGSQSTEQVTINGKAAAFIPDDQLIGLNWGLCDRSFLLEGNPPMATKDTLRKVAESVKLDCD